MKYLKFKTRFSEEEGLATKLSIGNSVEPPKSNGKHSGNSDLYMRLGLLLGNSRNERQQRSAPATRPASALQQIHQPDILINGSLANLENRTQASSNTSPVSTLTGTSSEAEPTTATLRIPFKSKCK